MAKKVKRAAPDLYEKAMAVWLQQRAEEIASCQRRIKQARGDIAHALTELAHSRRGIKLEQQQIVLARQSRDDGRADLAKHRRQQLLNRQSTIDNRKSK